jgi:hypothetical protein
MSCDVDGLDWVCFCAMGGVMALTGFEFVMDRTLVGIYHLRFLIPSWFHTSGSRSLDKGSTVVGNKTGAYAGLVVVVPKPTTGRVVVSNMCTINLIRIGKPHAAWDH